MSVLYNNTFIYEMHFCKVVLTHPQLVLCTCLAILVIFGDCAGHEYDTDGDYTSPFTRFERFYLDCVQLSSLSLVNTFVRDWLLK